MNYVFSAAEKRLFQQLNILYIITIIDLGLILLNFLFENKIHYILLYYLFVIYLPIKLNKSYHVSQYATNVDNNHSQ